jgi:hypothetical protein
MLISELVWRGFRSFKMQDRNTKTVPCEPPDVEVRAERVLDPSCHANEDEFHVSDVV